MSECYSSDQHVSVVVDIVVYLFTFLTSSKPLLGFASNFVWMFLGWTPTKFVKITVLPPIFNGIIGIYVHFLTNTFNQIFYKTTDQKSLKFGLESPQGI